MEDFARSLAAEVEKGFNPHFSQITALMTTQLPEADPRFPELGSFLTRHHEVQTAAYSNTFYFGKGTTQAAEAAKKISSEYRNTDAFANATVTDVKDAFDQPLDGSNTEAKES
ncbi:hypothetical protein AB0J80_02740 [Actinoplanes sp. NPDC049548]|uniref:hypothetical protein n=1 Tax=Actinoplanes sp. NPDC049548 TaxID=3155152 RepID=UPI00342D48B3